MGLAPPVMLDPLVQKRADADGSGRGEAQHQIARDQFLKRFGHSFTWSITRQHATWMQIKFEARRELLRPALGSRGLGGVVPGVAFAGLTDPGLIAVTATRSWERVALVARSTTNGTLALGIGVRLEPQQVMAGIG